MLSVSAQLSQPLRVGGKLYVAGGHGIQELRHGVHACNVRHHEAMIGTLD